jgi:hypothetical protein
MNLRNAWFGVFAILALTFLPRQVRADFIPPYDVPTGFLLPFNLANASVTPDGSWTLHESGTPLEYGGSMIQTSPSQISFNTSIAVFHDLSASLDLQFTHPVVSTGILTFDYSLSLQETTGPFAGWNYGGYILDGVLTKLSAGTGSVSLRVKSGDVFGFEAFATGNCFECIGGKLDAGATALTITHFVAPVPEPSASLLCFFGAAAFLGTQAMRRLRLSGRERTS